jgi:Flp pilus assembly protein TadD
MATKEVMVSAPLVVLLIDRQLFSGGFSEALRRRKGYYLGLFATWIPLCILAWNTGNRGGTSGFGSGVSVWKYWATQPEAIFRYLRLAIWPRPLVFDYGTEWLSTGGHPLNSYGVIFRVIVPVAVVAGLAATTLVGLARNRMYGVLGFLFFATLAPTSLIPGNHQTAAEHRMYLALIPVVVLVTAAVFRVFGRAAPAACLALAAAYGITAEVRNRDYSSEVAIWTDTAAKKPQNPLAHLNLGNVYSAYPSRSGEAIAQYEEALRLEPDFLEAHNNLGVLLAATPGRTEDAVGHFRRAIELNPRYADAHYNLGNALDSLGRTREAIAQFEEAVRLNPALVAARCNLGSDLGATDRTQDAIAQFEEALRLSPDDPVILYDLAFELLKSGGRAQAAAGP